MAAVIRLTRIGFYGTRCLISRATKVLASRRGLERRREAKETMLGLQKMLGE
jgi:coenzyme F420-reducing hydrogenase beta subunit